MLVMGILNATPDSFADGGEHFTYPDAVEHGLKLIAEGADLIEHTNQQHCRSWF